MGSAMRVFGLAAWSGSGKTTLLTGLIPCLVARGVTVSTVKHAHHTFDLDQPGKDSYRHRTAGAHEVMIAGAARWALLHEARGEPETELDGLLARMSPVDLVLVEGFKRHAHPKMEIIRPALGKPLLYPDDPLICALVLVEALSDDRLAGCPLPCYRADALEALADLVLDKAMNI